MSTIGQRAIVIGAGMGGLTAARALAPYFEHVVVIERDPSHRHTPHYSADDCAVKGVEPDESARGIALRSPRFGARVKGP